jgi:hypothetical protein
MIGRRDMRGRREPYSHDVPLEVRRIPTMLRNISYKAAFLLLNQGERRWKTLVGETDITYLVLILRRVGILRSYTKAPTTAPPRMASSKLSGRG